jgi:F0F1-type ATP synthase gamma subunit
MVNVEAELSKYKACKDREELERRIKEYKNLALKFASDIGMAGQYNMVALKLQEICNKLPAPKIKKLASSTSSTPVKTATITKEENNQIKAAWEKRAKNTPNTKE